MGEKLHHGGWSITSVHASPILDNSPICSSKSLLNSSVTATECGPLSAVQCTDTEEEDVLEKQRVNFKEHFKRTMEDLEASLIPKPTSNSSNCQKISPSQSFLQQQQSETSIMKKQSSIVSLPLICSNMVSTSKASIKPMTKNFSSRKMRILDISSVSTTSNPIEESGQSNMPMTEKPLHLTHRPLKTHHDSTSCLHIELPSIQRAHEDTMKRFLDSSVRTKEEAYYYVERWLNSCKLDSDLLQSIRKTEVKSSFSKTDDHLMRLKRRRNNSSSGEKQKYIMKESQVSTWIIARKMKEINYKVMSGSPYSLTHGQIATLLAGRQPILAHSQLATENPHRYRMLRASCT